MNKCTVLFLLLAANSVSSNVTATSNCGKKVVGESYLDIALDMVMKAKKTFRSCDSCENNLTQKIVDCADIFKMGHNSSGVYKISPMSRLTEDKSFDVYCDMETDGGGWTLIQRRGDYKRKKDFFYKDWKSYKEGFGDLDKDFWLGNDNIFALTNQRLYSARFDLKDVEHAKRYALYDNFWIDDENNQYTLHISDYSGDAGDSMMKEHNNQKFSTKDRENDKQAQESCAQKYKGGWWYEGCHQANLNGLYLNGKHDSFADGIEWFTWKGYHDSLASTEIKVRPKNFRRSPASSKSTTASSSTSASASSTPMKRK